MKMKVFFFPLEPVNDNNIEKNCKSLEIKKMCN